MIKKELYKTSDGKTITVTWVTVFIVLVNCLNGDLYRERGFIRGVYTTRKQAEDQIESLKRSGNFDGWDEFDIVEEKFPL